MEGKSIYLLSQNNRTGIEQFNLAVPLVFTPANA